MTETLSVQAPELVAPVVLPEAEWRAREAHHIARATELTRGHVARRKLGEGHPIEDFLFTYYNLKPAQLKRWHPGAGVVLEGAFDAAFDAAPGGSPARSTWRDYTRVGDTDLMVDARGFFARREATVQYIETLFERTMGHTPAFGCFGLHEWAMVYRLSADEIRHRALPLRLGAVDTDHVVEANPIACTHYDAFRFFTPEAVPLNTLQPTRETQPEFEQSGCLHAGMDVYKWAMKLGPIVPGEVLLDAFELAMQIRYVDMQASPYDVSSFGLEAIAIETPEGKSEYARVQRGFASRGDALRLRVLEAISDARALLG